VDAIAESLRLRSNTTKSLSWSMDAIPLNEVPDGEYRAFIGVTPHGDTSSYTVWETGFSLP